MTPKQQGKPSAVRIALTDDQKKQGTAASGEEVTTLELTAQELEGRIAPIIIIGG